MFYLPSCRTKSILSGTLAVLLLGIPAAAFSAAISPDAASAVARSGGQISITGDLAPATVQAVQHALAAPDGSAIHTLVIESTGGDIDSAMQLGRIVHARKLTVRIQRVCATVCAELLVPGAAHLVVPRGAVLVFTQMVSPGALPPNQKQDESQSGGVATPAIASSPMAKIMNDAIARQNAYFNDMKVNPDRVYAAANSIYVMKAALAAAGRADSPSLVPDASYLHDCLSIASVEMPDFTVSDSAKLAHMGKSPIAFLIDGNIYYEGTKIATFRPSCLKN